VSRRPAPTAPHDHATDHPTLPFPKPALLRCPHAVRAYFPPRIVPLTSGSSGSTCSERSRQSSQTPQNWSSAGYQRRKSGRAVTGMSLEARTCVRKIVELRGFEPLTSCMPFTTDLSEAVACCRSAARQGTSTVRLCRAQSAAALARSHLVSHWSPVDRGSQGVVGNRGGRRAPTRHLHPPAGRRPAGHSPREGPRGQRGNDSVASAAGSHPPSRLFGQATPGPGPTLRLRPAPRRATTTSSKPRRNS